MNSDAQWWRATSRTPALTPAAPRAAKGAGSNVPFYALLAFTFIMLLSPQSWLPALAPLRLALLSALVAVLAHAYSCLRRGLPVITFCPVVTITLSLLAWIVLTIPFSMWPGGSVEYLVANYSKTLIIFVLLMHVVDSFHKLNKVCWWLVLMSIPLALTTIFNYVSGQYLEGADARVHGYQAGLTANPNDMALMLNLIFCLCIALLLSADSAFKRLLLLAIASVIVAAIVATFSRAGFLTLGVIAICYAWNLRNSRHRIWVAVALFFAVAALPLAPSNYLQRINSIVNIETDATGSAQSRLSDMKTALKRSAAQPIFGAGIGMDILALNEARGEQWLQVHNVYLQFLLDLGILGLGLFLALYYKCYEGLSKLIRRGRSQHTMSALVNIGIGLKISLIAFAVSAMFYPVAYNFYFYYMAGLAVAAWRIYAKQDREGVAR